jgi:hypothetical protein
LSKKTTEDKLRTTVIAMLIAGLAVAFGWPLLFWGKVNEPRIKQQNPREVVFTPQHDPLW